MNKPHILMVEDDAAVGNLIATTLETQNYQFHRAKTGPVLWWTPSYRPDVMLLDLGLPDMDGVDIIKKVRTWSNSAHHRHLRPERGQRQGGRALVTPCQMTI